MDKQAKKIRRNIKRIGWSRIKLTQHEYRGAIKTFKTSTKSLVAIMFHLNEAFIVEDKEGVFGVQDLNYGLVQKDSIDLNDSGRIKGLSLVAFIHEDKVYLQEEVLERLDINTARNRKDIENRLLAVNKLSETDELEL
jgi:hypothetical protein